MTVRIITAPEQPTTNTQPVLFLAGPIQGAPNWQAEAIDHIKAAVPNCCTNSRRWTCRP